MPATLDPVIFESPKPVARAARPGRVSGSPSGLFRAWAVLAVAVAGVVLTLGALITTFGVGMSDPVWPTEPWFLAVNGGVWSLEPAPGFLIEHTHRLVAWAVGGVVAVLAVGAWRGEPDRVTRRRGTLAVLGLLAAYIALHTEMRVIWQGRVAGGGLRWPVASGTLVVVGAVVVAWVCRRALAAGSPGAGVRVAATLALAAVMGQGLLGGYRVFLNQLFGTQLAAVHGAFGQVTFALLAAVAAGGLATRPVPAGVRTRVGPVAVGLLVAVGWQLAWGVWVRHVGSGAAQRLHILTAFGVAGLVVWVAVAVLGDPAGRARLRWFAYALLGLLVVQLALGVEAYLGKFVAAGPAAKAVTATAAVVRTGHTLVGAAVLATAAVLVVRLAARPAGRDEFGPASAGRAA